MEKFALSVVGCLVLCAALLSCTKDEDIGNGKTLVKDFSLSAVAGEVRSTIDASGTGNWPVKWATNDVIYYYTGKTSGGATAISGARKSYTVTEDGTSVTVPVEYQDGDNGVVFFTVGSSIGEGTLSNNMATLTVTDAVPATQKGTFEECHIGVASRVNGLLAASPSATLIPVQAFIKFKMSSLTFGDKTVEKIEFNASDMTGNLSITASTGATSATGTKGSKITIDRSTGESFFADKDYYIAVLPGTYTQITANLYNGTDKLATVYIKKTSGNYTVTKGAILDIGDLNVTGRKHVPATTVTMYPTFAAFHKDMTDGKKIWLRVEPSDFDGTVTWNIYQSGSTSTASTSMDITPGIKENLEGVGECYTAVVKPKSTITSYSKYTSDVIATVANKEGTASVTRKCELELGEYVYMGSLNKDGKKVLWAMGEMLLSGSTASIEHNQYMYGSWFQWGANECRTGTQANYTYFGGNWYGYDPSGTESTTLQPDTEWFNGGDYNKYYSNDWGELKAAHDIVTIKFGSNFRTPSLSDYLGLVSLANSTRTAHWSGTEIGCIVQSTITGYSDMYVIIPAYGTSTSQHDRIYTWTRNAAGQDVGTGGRAYWMRSETASEANPAPMAQITPENWYRYSINTIRPVQYR